MPRSSDGTYQPKDSAQNGGGHDNLSRKVGHGVAFRYVREKIAARAKNNLDQTGAVPAGSPIARARQKTARLRLRVLRLHFSEAKERARDPQWYEGWALITYIYPEGKKRWVFRVPNSKGDRKIYVMDGLSNSKIEGIIELLDSAMSTLNKPAQREHHVRTDDAAE